MCCFYQCCENIMFTSTVLRWRQKSESWMSQKPGQIKLQGWTPGFSEKISFLRKAPTLEAAIKSWSWDYSWTQSDVQNCSLLNINTPAVSAHLMFTLCLCRDAIRVESHSCFTTYSEHSVSDGVTLSVQHNLISRALYRWNRQHLRKCYS